MDALPVSFAQSTHNLDGTLHRASLHTAVHHIVQDLSKEGFHFRQRRFKPKSLRYTYHCSQDLRYALKSVARPSGPDREQMKRFSCNSLLTITVTFETRLIHLRLSHNHHAPYENHKLSPEVLDFVNENIQHCTPAKLYQNLQHAKPSGWETALRHQIHYRWQQHHSSLWRRDDDPFQSANLLLTEVEDISHAVYSHGNVQALAIFINKAMQTLASSTKELAMDATYGTNNAGMTLYAVMAELDGSGVPIVYCFLKTTTSVSGESQHAHTGSITSVLKEVLNPLVNAGFNPSFFGTDKDQAEISAIQSTWPNVKHQLCYWHVRRALRQRLTSNKVTRNHGEYRPDEVRVFVLDAEICWASVPTSRPNGAHR